MVKIVRSSIGGKPCSIDERALIMEANSPMLSVIFDHGARFKYNEHHDMYVPFLDVFQHICDFLSTGRMHANILKKGVDYVCDMIEMFNLSFIIHTTDYSASQLGLILENQWYRSRRYHRLYIDDWTPNFTNKITDTDIMHIRKTYKSVAYIKGNMTSDAHMESRRNTIAHFHQEGLDNVLVKHYYMAPTPDITRDPYLMKATFVSSIIDHILKSNKDPRKFVKEICSRVDELKDVLTEDMLEYDMEDKDSLYTVFKALYRKIGDWMFDGHMVIAGGSVCDFVSGMQNPKDIDIFFVGCTQTEAQNKIVQLCKLMYDSTIFLRHLKNYYLYTDNSITIYDLYKSLGTSRPGSPVQFVLRLYKDMEEVLMGFDLDPSAIGFDGNDIYMTRACKTSLDQRLCVVNFDRLSMNYEARLCKYAKNKAFGIYIPNLKQVNVNKCYAKYSGPGIATILSWYKYDSIPKVKQDYEHVTPKQIHDNIDKIVSKRIDEYWRTNSRHKVNTIGSLFTDKIVKWKIINPGQQVTGSFHALVYNDISEWYRVYADEDDEDDEDEDEDDVSVSDISDLLLGMVLQDHIESI